MRSAVDEPERANDSRQVLFRLDRGQKDRLQNVPDKLVFHMILDMQDSKEELRLLDKLPFDSERPIDELDIPDYKILNIMIAQKEKRWR